MSSWGRIPLQGGGQDSGDAGAARMKLVVSSSSGVMGPREKRPPLGKVDRKEKSSLALDTIVGFEETRAGGEKGPVAGSYARVCRSIWRG